MENRLQNNQIVRSIKFFRRILFACALLSLSFYKVNAQPGGDSSLVLSLDSILSFYGGDTGTANQDSLWFNYKDSIGGLNIDSLMALYGGSTGTTNQDSLWFNYKDSIGGLNIDSLMALFGGSTGTANQDSLWANYKDSAWGMNIDSLLASLLGDTSWTQKQGINSKSNNENKVAKKVSTSIDEVYRVGDNTLNNYPNPFNESTMVNYSLNEESIIELNLYDLLGNKVAELANGMHAPGAYSKELNANNLSSGIYMLTLNTGDKISTKKIILEK